MYKSKISVNISKRNDKNRSERRKKMTFSKERKKIQTLKSKQQK